ncbi:MAG: ABC transporter permease [Devosia sp. 67-54]|uniref:carbohydrate ABC transporter permease n=1 Tax=unclassified Devosia TaxID=196773 RepID=UPI000965AF00|nr:MULTISPECIES: sugar ABC transporter permease [unclassified Devosia]OJX15892.1 MAG: ABC transporter permease [Devosia sp. 67-54]
MAMPQTAETAVPHARPAAALRPAPRGRKRDTVPALVMLTPWLLGVTLLTALPMVASLVLSFTNYDLLSLPRFIGTANYQRLLSDPRYIQSLEVTTTYVLVSVPLSVTVALLIAVSLSSTSRSANLYRGIYYLPSLLGGSVAIGVLWRQLFGGQGLLNSVLGLFGVAGTSWIGDPRYSLGTLIILHIWQFGAPMVIFLAGARQIPKETIEASIIDGANPVQRFFRLTLPLLSPLILFNLVMQTITAFQAFVPAYVVSDGSGGPIDSTLFYTLYLYIEGFRNFHMGYAMAMAWVLLVIIAVFTALAFWSSRFWVHYEN